MKRWALLALLLPVAVIAQDAPYYLPFKMLNTSADPFPYYVDGRSQTPAGLNFANVQTATTTAWKRWDDLTCASTAFKFLGPTTAAAVPEPRDMYDVSNVSTIWISARTDPFYPNTVSNSDITAITLPLTYAGVLQQCDIYMNAADRTWSTAATTPQGSVDVESIVLHEAGHCQGLDHSSVSSLEVMYYAPPIGEQRRVLQTRDVNALCQRYPSSGAVGSPCNADGGCGTTAGLKCVKPPLSDGGTGLPFCTVGCPTGQNFPCEIPYVCQPSPSFSPTFNGACLSPGNFVTQVGKPCTDNVECGSTNGVCQKPEALPSTFTGWQDGYCMQDCAAGQPPCPAGSSCIDFGNTLLRCLKQCRVGVGDCRPGYTCVLPSDSGPGVCVPSCHGDVDCNAPNQSVNQCRTCDGTCLSKQNPAGQIGDVCSTSDSCGIGQVCAKFTNSNVGICSQACAKTCTTCPGGSTCHPVGTRGELFCLRDCQTGTCPVGLQCGQLSTGTGCMPPCKNDTECPVGLQCTFGECKNPNVGTDAGCALCPDPNKDGGKPTNGAPDAGTAPPPGQGGCGCGGAGPGAPLLAALVLVLSSTLGRRRSWRRH
jgi:hypothetical protein